MANLLFLKKLFTYFCLLFSILVILGTFTISLFLKSMIAYMRHSGWLVDNERTVIIVTFLILIFFTLLFAKWLTIWLMESTNKRSRNTFIIMTSVLLIMSLFYWIPFGEIPFSRQFVSRDQRFTGGPYPDEVKIDQLKAQGYTTIISLLDPLVLPQEPFLIKQEEESVARSGLNLIRIPMVTGKIDTIEANKRIESLAKNTAREKYYVHGFRENERVALFMKKINSFLTKPVVANFATNTLTQTKINISPKSVHKNNNTIRLERGNTVLLDNHVIASPKPTLDEFKKYFISTPNKDINIPIRTVISLNPDDVHSTSAELSDLLKANRINYINTPVQLYPYDPEAILKVVKKVKAMTNGALVYSYYMPPQSAVMSAFILSWQTNLPALPKNLFDSTPMQAGMVKIIAPNVAIGEKPDKSEFADYLVPRGIRGIGYAGDCNASEATTDEKIAQSAGLKWICLKDKDSIVISKIKTDGPWFVYGPALPLIENELINRLQKLMPANLI